jgi:hypothetical protein
MADSFSRSSAVWDEHKHKHNQMLGESRISSAHGASKGVWVRATREGISWWHILAWRRYRRPGLRWPASRGGRGRGRRTLRRGPPGAVPRPPRPAASLSLCVTVPDEEGGTVNSQKIEMGQNLLTETNTAQLVGRWSEPRWRLEAERKITFQDEIPNQILHGPAIKV